MQTAGQLDFFDVVESALGEVEEDLEMKEQLKGLVEDCLEHCKEFHGLDLAVLKKRLSMDTFSYIR